MTSRTTSTTLSKPNFFLSYRKARINDLPKRTSQEASHAHTRRRKIRIPETSEGGVIVTRPPLINSPTLCRTLSATVSCNKLDFPLACHLTQTTTSVDCRTHHYYGPPAGKTNKRDTLTLKSPVQPGTRLRSILLEHLASAVVSLY